VPTSFSETITLKSSAKAMILGWCFPVNLTLAYLQICRNISICRFASRIICRIAGGNFFLQTITPLIMSVSISSWNLRKAFSQSSSIFLPMTAMWISSWCVLLLLCILLPVSLEVGHLSPQTAASCCASSLKQPRTVPDHRHSAVYPCVVE
jgi:hypothetical protein